MRTGELTVTLGFEEYVLGPGDSVSFESTLPHRLHNAGSEVVTAVWIVLDRPLAVSELVDIGMPRLSDSMEEATILRWLKEPGDAVARGEPLVEVETDKATVVYEAELDGVLEEIVAAEGETVALGAVIARVRPGSGALAARPRRRSTQPQASDTRERTTAPRSSSGKRSGRRSTRSSSATSA